MGKLCSKQSQTVSNLIDTEKEVNLATYKTDADKIYEIQENKFNYLRKINFADFLYSLVHFSNENATLEDQYDKANLNFSMNDAFFCEYFPNDILQSFLENKILKHQAIYAEAGNNEKATGIFKETILQLNSALGLKLAQNAKEKGDEGADKNNIVTKGHALAYGLLYCVGANFVKIRALFNIFKTGEILKPSDKFSDFLLSLMLIPSYCSVSAKNKLQKFDEIEKIDKAKLTELLDFSELKDCQNLVNVTNQLIFGRDLSITLTYQNFKDKFEVNDKDHSLAFMLSPSGVRYMLQKHNVS